MGFTLSQKPFIDGHRDCASLFSLHNLQIMEEGWYLRELVALKQSLLREHQQVSIAAVSGTRSTGSPNALR